MRTEDIGDHWIAIPTRGMVKDSEKQMVACIYGEAGNPDVDSTMAERTHLFAASPNTLAALRRAEAFIAGFEGDELQEGIADLLKQVRDAIAKAEGR